MDTAATDPIERISLQLSRLPGVGRKSARRLAYYIVSQPEEDVRELAAAIWQGRKSVRMCSRCGNYTAADPCALCTDPRRNARQLCVVRDPRDVAAIERTREYHGLYHVLHGTLSPIDGIGPDDIRIRPLLERIGPEKIEEVILATNPDVEGEATAVYIARLLKPFGIRVTRIAHGMPMGGDLEYVDEMTLSKAFEGRREL